MATINRRFEGLLERYFEQLIAEDPVFATMTAGVSSGEGKLGSLGTSFHDKRERRRRAALRELGSQSPRDLTNEQQIDRLALRSRLLRESEDYARGRHRIEPNAPEQLLGILFHELRRGADEPRRAASNLASLLKSSPDFLDEAAKTLKTPEKVWVNVMEETVAGSGMLLKGVGAFLSANGTEGDERSIAATAKAITRYRDRALSLPSAPAGSFAIGAAGLERRIRDELALDYTLGQIDALATAEAERIGALLNKASARFGRNRAPEDILADARRAWKPNEPLLELYRHETTRIAQAFRKAQAVSFPDKESLEVRPVPEFLRMLIPTAAYTQPGAFDRKQKGIFWVNDLGQTKNTPAEKLAEQQQHFGLSLTCAHEAYPGHHLQFVTANQHPRKWRRLFAHAVFYEGWTLWCEQMMVDLRIDGSSWLQLQQLHDALWRCHRILVDLRLQTRRYTYDQAVRHLQRHVGFTKARAQADVNWYTGAPGVPMSYWLGRLENERLHRRFVQGRGWPLRRFNDWLLSFGTVPQAWIEKYGTE
ncbi:MAG TPA: DUF885 domain-containing protein [Verrucomicrobiae bacterium]|nr:DUF885 domain-containing protein [Verrucomicrobiae bacterium]